jgi:hypothetical protein
MACDPMQVRGNAVKLTRASFFLLKYSLRGSARSLTWGGLRSLRRDQAPKWELYQPSVIAVTFDGTLFWYGH